MTTITRKEAGDILKSYSMHLPEKVERFLDSIFYDKRDDCVVEAAVFVRAAFLYYDTTAR